MEVGKRQLAQWARTIGKFDRVNGIDPIGLAKNTVALDNTIAIRIPEHDFCRELISSYGKPIVSTSANISGEPTPKSFSEITGSVIDRVDYTVNLERDKISFITA